jgi:hypothetical protein
MQSKPPPETVAAKVRHRSTTRYRSHDKLSPDKLALDGETFVACITQVHSVASDALICSPGGLDWHIPPVSYAAGRGSLRLWF